MDASTRSTAAVRHIVMWNVAGETPEDRDKAKAQIKTAFESLRGLIPGMTCLEIGIDVSRIDYACDVVLFSEFESAEALKAYAVHPAHLRIRDALEGLRITRHQVDYPVNGERDR